MIKKIFYSITAIMAIASGTMAQTARKLVVLQPLQDKDTLAPGEYIRNGFYTVPLKYVSGAIGRVDGDVIEHSLAPNFQAALQGRLAGVHVIQANGMPAADVTLRIRGTSSIYGENNPLYVIDGVPIYAGPREMAPRGVGGDWGSTFNPLTDINPDDIESIEVLKDGAAAALYGARGGNGVIVVTTRTGQRNAQDRDDVRLHYYYGITNPTNRLHTLSGPQYLQVLDKAWQNSGNTGQGPLPTIPGFTRADAETINTDHMDQLLENGQIQHVSISAGYDNQKTSFYFSGAYHNEKGILSGNTLARYTGRLKVTNQVTKRLSLGVNSAISFTDHDNMPVGYAPGGGFAAAQRNLPVYRLTNPDTRYFYPSDPAVYNLPGSNVASFQSKGNFDNEEHARRIMIAANLTYDVLPGLDLRVDGAMDMYNQTRRDYLSKYVRYGSIGSGAGREGLPTAYAGYEKYQENVYNVRTTLNYQRSGRDYKLTGVAGFEMYYNDNPYFFAEGEGFVSDFLRQPSMASYRNTTSAAAIVTNVNAFTGYFANANYSWKEKFLASATLRVEGSSRYGADQKYFPFPAASAGYILSKEDFLKGNAVINSLKLRASYGRVGNSGIGNYSSLESWTLTTSSRYLLQAGIHANSFGSPALEPEKQDQFNIGADFSLLRNRLSGAVDYYNKTTRDMLLSFDAPPSAGVQNPGLLLNAGSMRNSGVEVSLASRNLVGAFKWTTELNIARNKNTVLDLGGASIDNYADVKVYEGQSLGVFYLAEYAGTDPATGAEMIYDQSGNKVIATSAAQVNAARKPQYNKPSMPKFFGGMNNTFTYRNFDLNAFVTFSYGNYILDEGERELSYAGGTNNLREEAAHADFPRLLYNDPVANINTTRFLHDASYLRMKNVSLGYTFKSMLKRSKFLRNARLYVSAQNLFTITGYNGWDPEVTGNFGTSLERSLRQGITYMDVPQRRTFATGFNLNF